MPRRTPDLGWGHPLRAPEWVTPAAADTARAVLHATGEQAQPLAADRGQHLALTVLRIQEPHYRQLSRVFATAGLRLELPYFDDRVIETALAVRLHERRTPWQYKPLLAAAMRGILPEVIAARTTKGEFGEDVRAGLRRHLPDILELFADSALATCGLINPDLLRRQLLAPQVDNAAVHAFKPKPPAKQSSRSACAAPAKAAYNAPSPPPSTAAPTAPGPPGAPESAPTPSPPTPGSKSTTNPSANPTPPATTDPSSPSHPVCRSSSGRAGPAPTAFASGCVSHRQAP